MIFAPTPQSRKYSYAADGGYARRHMYLMTMMAAATQRRRSVATVHLGCPRKLCLKF